VGCHRRGGGPVCHPLDGTPARCPPIHETWARFDSSTRVPASTGQAQPNSALRAAPCHLPSYTHSRHHCHPRPSWRWRRRPAPRRPRPRPCSRRPRPCLRRPRSCLRRPRPCSSRPRPCSYRPRPWPHHREGAGPQRARLHANRCPILRSRTPRRGLAEAGTRSESPREHRGRLLAHPITDEEGVTV
jgi:hypothetical protein